MAADEPQQERDRQEIVDLGASGIPMRSSSCSFPLEMSAAVPSEACWQISDSPAHPRAIPAQSTFDTVRIPPFDERCLFSFHPPSLRSAE